MVDLREMEHDVNKKLKYDRENGDGNPRQEQKSRHPQSKLDHERPLMAATHVRVKCASATSDSSRIIVFSMDRVSQEQGTAAIGVAYRTEVPGSIGLMKRYLFAIVVTLFGCVAWAQVPNGAYGPSSGGGGSSTTSVSAVPGFPGVTSVPITSGLIAEYRILPTESPAALVDYSGNGNNATGTAGVAPTIIPVTGGISCPGTGGVVLPAGLNSALTIIAFIGYQLPSVSTDSAILSGSTFNIAFDINSGGGAPILGQGILRTVKPGLAVTQAYASALGTNVVAVTMGTTDVLYLNGVAVPDYTTGPGTSAGLQSSGAWQICGAGALYYTGQIYYMALYNRVLTAAEIAGDSKFILSAMANRNVPQSLQSSVVGNTYTCVGDSITVVNGAPLSWCNNMPGMTNGSWTTFNFGLAGRTAQSESTAAKIDNDLYMRQPANGRSIINIFEGINDFATPKTGTQIIEYLMNWCRGRKNSGYDRVFMVSMISNTLYDAGKDVLDPLERQYWRGCFDGFTDLGGTLGLGADGQSATGFFQVDHIHPTQQSVLNIMAPLIQRTFNDLYAAQDFSTGNTYTTTATVPATITAATEATNTMTFTVANTFSPGQCAIVTGVTPAGYNSTTANLTMGCWFILTASSSAFTAYNGTTGLGAGTIFGTAVVPQELDVDVYATLGGSAVTPIHTLQTCQGRTGQPIYRRITNSTSPWTITPFLSTETIDGGATFTAPLATSTNWPIVKLESVLVSAAAAGCTWKASLQ
jgi:hypothetical protein